MNKQWPKKSVPDDGADRLKLAVATAKAVPLSDEARKRVDEILVKWFQINEMATALGITLTKRDYRDFMLCEIGVKQ